ncbi:hypothetical protein [Porphyrobacter sp. HT-58-2]|uniref:hypothetical protein n=1 Tax=Porphyrobacter sp. HT-58-2 TaxID=2023229 RepID=UPI0011B0424D|nr:hypothetical protein [Porphyrobacter sp. HT-58-2]
MNGLFELFFSDILYAIALPPIAVYGLLSSFKDYSTGRPPLFPLTNIDRESNPTIFNLIIGFNFTTYSCVGLAGLYYIWKVLS